MNRFIDSVLLSYLSIIDINDDNNVNSPRLARVYQKVTPVLCRPVNMTGLIRFLFLQKFTQNDRSVRKWH